MRKKLVVILPSLRLFRALVGSELFTELPKKFELEIVVSKNDSEGTINSLTKILEYPEPDLLKRFHKFVLDIETYHKRSQNISYETRIRLITNLPLSKSLSFKSFIQSKSKYGIALALVSNRAIYAVLGRALRAFGCFHPGLKKLLFNSNPDLILCFSGGFYSGVENFLGRFGRTQSVPVFLIIDNWDNLSSKSVLWEKPTLLGVWGPEMEIDAKELHGFDTDSVVFLGSSRLDLPEFGATVKWVSSIRPYALFAGTGIQHIDEFHVLRMLRQVFNTNGLRDFNIVYRPHPWNLRGDFKDILFEVSSIEGVIIDQDIVANGSDSFYSLNSLPHLETLVKNCEFLIAGHSTVIVEALYHGKKVLALSDSSHPLFPNSDSWSIYRHMSRLRGNEGIFECREFSEIESALVALQKAPINETNLVPELLPNFTTTYQERVISNLFKIAT